MLDGTQSRPDGAISPKAWARTGGWLYLYIILAGGLAELFVRGKLVMSGDAAATAHNIIASEQLWRIAFAGDIMVNVFAVVLALIFYVLLRPVNPYIALLSVLFDVTEAAIASLNELNHFAPLLLLKGARYLTAFDPQQLHALALLSAKLYEFGFGISLVFFGFDSLCRGYLMFRSGYFPRWLGILILISGLSYLTNSFVLFVSPALSDLISSWVLVSAGLPELVFCVWLIVVGVDERKWPFGGA